ncbi:MAG: radical SAM protein [Bacteroidales bacterium]|nr:radical SAM protein [Bacteroidales bacterium]
MSKILFIRPQASPETIGLQHLMIVEPLELEILFGLVRETDQAEIIDMLVEKQSFDYFINLHKPDIICLTGYITNVATIIDYCKIAKNINPHTISIVGGVHCEVVPEDFENEAVDFRVVRNAAIIFADLLNHIDNKSDLPTGVLAKNEKPDISKLPDFNFYVPWAIRKSVEKYRDQYFYIFHDKVALVKTSFGCPFNCSFCFCTVITAEKYNQRPLDDVIKELKTLPEKEIYIVDDDFLTDKNRLELFIEKSIEHNISKKYLVYGRADFIANNPELIEKLAKIGLRTVIVGFESFFEDDLKKYNKNTNVGLYKKTMKVLNDNKIDCYATMIVSPDWDKNDFKKMVKSVKSLGIHYVNLQPLTPLPKTGFSYPEEQLLIKKEEYEKWDLAHVSIKPSKMSVAEYYKEILKAYNKILFQPKVVFNYLKLYKSNMLWKMISGSSRVRKQYQNKTKQSKTNNLIQ